MKIDRLRDKLVLILLAASLIGWTVLDRIMIGQRVGKIYPPWIGFG